jgi:hypothetical protein
VSSKSEAQPIICKAASETKLLYETVSSVMDGAKTLVYIVNLDSGDAKSVVHPKLSDWFPNQIILKENLQVVASAEDGMTVWNLKDNSWDTIRCKSILCFAY